MQVPVTAWAVAELLLDAQALELGGGAAIQLFVAERAPRRAVRVNGCKAFARAPGASA